MEMENELVKLQRIDRELEGQNQVLEMLATGKSLTDILNALIGTLESQLSGTRCSILILDASGQYLNLESGPSLPELYRKILKDIKIGPDAGICGTAAYKNEFVFSEDIEQDPRCACFKVLALAHNLRACGSTPIKNVKGQILGTLCLYFDQPRKPDEIELKTVRHAAYLAGIAIQFKKAETLRKKAVEEVQRAQKQSAHFGRLLDSSSNEIYTFDIATLKFIHVNYGACKNLGYTMEELSEMTPVDLKPDFPPEKFDELIRPLRQGENNRATFQTVHQRKNGTTYPVEVHLQMMENEDPPVFLAVIEDITGRKKIEQHLSFIEHGVEYAGDGAFWVEADSARMVYVNSSACQSLGYSREELLGMTIMDIDPDFSKDALAAHLEVIKKVKKLTFETHHRRKDGTIFPVEITSHYVVYEGKEYNVAFSRDISKRKKSDLLIQNHNRILGMLATGESLTEILDAITIFAEEYCENLMCGILILDPDTKTMHFKSAPSFPKGYVEAINGFKIGPEVPSCGTAAFHNRVNITEDVETDPLWKTYLPVARQFGIKACWSTPIRDSRGQVLGTFSFIPGTPRKPRDEETQFIKSVSHLAGIAIERKQVERKMHFIHHGISHAGDEAFWVDWETGRFVYVNAKTCKNLGYTEEELLTMSPYDIDMEAKRENWPKHREEMVREKTMTFESVQRRKDGTTFPVELTSHLIEYEGKKFIITFGRDITERKKNEAEIIHAKDSAEKANDAKSHFLSRMSHEFRTPMNAILGFAQIMKMDPDNKLDRQYRESVHHILKAGHHLKLLIDDVLDLTMVESGNIELALESIPVAPVIRDIISQMEPLRKSHDIHVITEDLTESKHVIVADKMRFQQILINLISNAIKYNRKGGTLSIAVSDHPDQTVSIRVQDTGQGFPKESMDDLFEPFNRLNFENGDIEGTGIGLSIVRDLVSLMKGTLKVESTVGEGSCFTVSFPLGDRTQIKSNEFTEPDSPKESVPVTGPIQILYIEDDPTNSRLVENIISIKPNLSLKIAETAEEGIEIAKAQRPDIILMDIRLPGIDGFEAFRRLRRDSQTQSIPIVAVTAHAMTADIKKARDMGFDSYLTKPLDIPLFFQTIEKHSRKL